MRFNGLHSNRKTLSFFVLSLAEDMSERGRPIVRGRGAKRERGGAVRSRSTGRDVSAEARRERADIEEALRQSVAEATALAEAAPHVVPPTVAVLPTPVAAIAPVHAFPDMLPEAGAAAAYPTTTPAEIMAATGVSLREARLIARDYNIEIRRLRRQFILDHAHPVDDGPDFEPDHPDAHHEHPPTVAEIEAHAANTARMTLLRNQLADELQFRRARTAPSDLLARVRVITRDGDVEEGADEQEACPSVILAPHQLTETMDGVVRFLKSAEDDPRFRETIGLTLTHRERIREIETDTTITAEVRRERLIHFVRSTVGPAVIADYARKRAALDTTSTVVQASGEAESEMDFVVRVLLRLLAHADEDHPVVIPDFHGAAAAVASGHGAAAAAAAPLLAAPVGRIPDTDDAAERLYNWAMSAHHITGDRHVAALAFANAFRGWGGSASPLALRDALFRMGFRGQTVEDAILFLETMLPLREGAVRGFGRTATSGLMFEYSGTFFDGSGTGGHGDVHEGPLTRTLNLVMNTNRDRILALNRGDEEMVYTEDEFLGIVIRTLYGLRELFDGSDVLTMVREIIRREMTGSRFGALKICPEIGVRVLHASKDSIQESVVVGQTIVFNADDDEAAVSKKVEDMIANLALMVFERNYMQSGVHIHSISTVKFFGAKLTRSVRGGRWIETPKDLANRTCTRNIFSEGNNCGQYAVALAVYLLSHNSPPYGGDVYSCTEYGPIIDSLNWDGMSFPVEPCEWTRFERLNPTYGVFVYEWDNEKARAIMNRIPSNRATASHYLYLILVEKEIEVSFINEESGEEQTRKELFWHYITVTSLSRLFDSQATDETPGGIICPICINKIKQQDYQYHVMQCLDICETRMVFPPPGTRLRFNKFLNERVCPVVILADTESMLRPVEDSQEEVVALKEGGVGKSGVVITQEHVPIAYGLRVLNMYETQLPALTKACPLRLLVGDDPFALTESFIALLEEYATTLTDMLRPTEANRHPRYNFELTKPRQIEINCCVCRGLLAEESKMEGGGPIYVRKRKNQKDDDKRSVPVVDHYTGVYEGHAHDSCAKRVANDLKKPKITVWFHNGTGYDMKILLSHIGGTRFASQLNDSYVLAKSSERISRFDIAGVQIKDSMSHLPRSLSELVTRITSTEQAITTNCLVLKDEVCRRYSHVPDIDSLWKVLARKGEFPYSWLDSWEKLNHTGLPDRHAFDSDLGIGSKISDADYAFAVSVYESFHCTSFRDYLELYLLTDVCLLADVWRQYRIFMLDNYKLDPARFESLPALAFASALKTSNAELDLISDPDIALFFQRSIRGGISYAVHPHAIANNTCTREIAGDPDTIPRADDNWILYFDANTLYGGCMQEFLPYQDFQFMEEGLCTLDTMHSILDTVRDRLDSPIGYMIEVDMEYSPDLHELFNDLPPAPDTCNVDVSFLHKQQYDAIEAMGSLTLNSMGKFKKLVPSLLPKTRYICYGTTLALYVELGVTITKVHRIVSFVQAPFMRDFIHLNIRLRQEAQQRGDPLGVDLAKFSGNSAYGKTIQDVLRETHIKLVHSAESDTDKQKSLIQKEILKNNWKRAVSMGMDIWVVEQSKRLVEMNKPIQVGAVILEISKYIMYRFWYKVLKPKFGTRLRLLYMDTDSFIMDIVSPDAYAELVDIERESNGGESVSVPGQGWFDWSSMSQIRDNSRAEFGSNVNQLVPYKFKNELGSKHVITEGIFVRSKMYQLKMLDRSSGNTELKNVAKGVPRPCRKQLVFSNCVEKDGKSQDCVASMIRSKKMKVTTGVYKKKALPASVLSNDKRFLFVSDTVNEEQLFNSFALGHYATYDMCDETV